MPDTKKTLAHPSRGESLQHLIPFTVHIGPELQERIRAFTRTEEERAKFTQNALAMLADVYEGKRKMPGYNLRLPEKTEELPSFF